VDGCDRPNHCNGYCQMHWWRVKYKGDPGPAGNIKRIHGEAELCEAEGCDRRQTKRTWCDMHYGRLREAGQLPPAQPVMRAARPSFAEPCPVDGCDRPRTGKLYCKLHYERLRRTGELGPAQSMSAPKGSGHLNKQGYRRIVVDHRRVLEHIYVMEQILGRDLWPDESVHHKNGIRDDNRPENLELWNVERHGQNQRCGQRAEDIVEYWVSLYPELAAQALRKVRRQLRKAG
jgi:hypothetical protein